VTKYHAESETKIVPFQSCPCPFVLSLGRVRFGLFCSGESGEFVELDWVDNDTSALDESVLALLHYNLNSQLLRLA